MEKRCLKSALRFLRRSRYTNSDEFDALYAIENDISEDSNRCLILKENRLKLYAIELLNIVYMIDGQ